MLVQSFKIPLEAMFTNLQAFDAVALTAWAVSRCVEKDGDAVWNAQVIYVLHLKSGIGLWPWYCFVLGKQ